VAPLQPLHRCDGSTNNHTDVAEWVATEQTKKEWAYQQFLLYAVTKNKNLKRVIFFFFLKTPQKNA
jgi:hypothetical protein